MKRISLVLISICLMQTATAQKARHDVYDLAMAQYFQLPVLPTPTKIFSLSCKWNVISNDRFSLVFPSNIVSDSDLEGKITIEQGDDTMLFDKKHYKVYIFSERTCYGYQPGFVMPGNNFRKVSKDTLTEFSNQLPSGATPLPNMIPQVHGIRLYKTQNFNFRYREGKLTNLLLDQYFEGVKGFRFSPEPLPIRYY